MTVWVFRDGALVEKRLVGNDRSSSLPTPYISRMEPFESPVTGKEISSWRERDRDMAAAGAVDPRDLPPPTNGRADHGRRTEPDPAPFQWRDPDG
jgi:hypothetical protein